MTIASYIQEKKSQIHRLETELEHRTHLDEKLAPFRAKRDALVHGLEQLAGEAGDRIDILRMGVESAWAELQAAFDAATDRPKP